MSVRTLKLALAMTAAIGQLSLAAPAQAQEQPRSVFRLPSMSLDDTLRAIGRQSGREIMYPADLVKGVVAPALSVEATTDEVIRMALHGTGLDAEFRPDVVIIRGRATPSDVRSGSVASTDVVVTGTRIRGADGASPRTVVTRETMRDQGFNDLGSFARSLPQNFAGGQNPGVVGGGQQGDGNENITSSSTFNLRGLGADATLTLVNGHRVAFDAISNGIDISAIPLLAVDRVELVTDGASAIYGSDAVGGVANVVLRKSFKGLLTAARVGTATEGGDTQVQVDGVGGAQWASGGLVTALSYTHATPVEARQRSFTRSLNGSATLLPRQDQVSGTLVVTQQIADGVRLDLDAELNHRRSALGVAFTVADDFRTSGLDEHSRLDAFAITPTLTAGLAGGWTLTGSAGLSQSKSLLQSQYRFFGLDFGRYNTRYDNRLITGEIGAEGPLFATAGGEIRLSVGAGHRSARLTLNAQSTVGGTVSITQAFIRSQEISFGYAEIFAPLVGPANAAPLLRRLDLSAAARYERYAGADGLVTPKLGLAYAPTTWLVLKATYGRSFKAPTLYQRYLIRNGGILQAAIFGENPPVALDAVAFYSGGSPTLDAERATTWSGTAQLTPGAVRRLTLEASYFHIDFQNRVVTPVASFSDVLTNPAYRQLLTFNPTAGQLAAVAATLPLGLTNQTGLPLASLNVIALLDITLRNAASQLIQGVDLSGRYDLVANDDSHLFLAGSASYLKLAQQLTSDAPSQELTGRVFHPPHWRARGSLDWDHRGIGGSAVFNYVGGTLDRRTTPYVRVASFPTVDLVGRVRATAHQGVAAGFEASLSVVNVFDRKPDIIRSNDPTNPPYDSTNYSSLGRLVSLTLSKRW